MGASSDFIPVEAAERLLREHPADWGTEDCPLAQAVGRTLREPVHADRDLPPFNRVTMDGIALTTAAWREGRRDFLIAFTQAAGDPARQVDDPATCARVMTGAVLPGGTDCVVPVEELRVDGETAHLPETARVEAGQFIHRQGVDTPAGQVLLQAGSLLTPPRLMIAAAAGAHTLRVARHPRVAVVSTGDELVEPSETPAPHQVRSSNSYALESALRQFGVNEVQRVHLPDDLDELRTGLRALMESHHVLILSGGVSAGDFDFVPQALSDLGVKKVFHKVRQRPGKPLWFGHSPSGVPVFALPGNPVSTLVCYYRFIQPWLAESLGRAPTPHRVLLDEPVTFEPPLTYFLQVKTSADGRARPVPHHGSGDFASLAETDGFVELPDGEATFPRGFSARYVPWR